MPITQFRQTRVLDNDLRQVQDAAALVFQDILSRDLLDGRVLRNVVLNGSKLVNHGLGRKLQGYIVIMKDSNVDIWDSQATNTTPALNLLLNSSGSVKVSLWVF